MVSTAPQTHPEGPIRALLWDVDGTLAETELEGHRRAFNRAFSEEGLPWHWDVDTYLQLLRVTGGRERMRSHGLDRGHPLGAEQIERLVCRKQQHYEELVRSGGVRLRPGVRRLIHEAAEAGLAQVIVTTSGRASVQALLDAHGEDLAGCFAFWVCGEDVERKKPDPQGYRLAAERLGLEAAHLLAIEDSRLGLQAAATAGLSCLVTLSESSRREAGPSGREGFEAALAVLDSLGEGRLPLRRHDGPKPPEDQVTLAWLQHLRAAA